MIGSIVRDFAPTPVNNRNSEGAFLELSDGSIFFAYSRYGSDGSYDWSSADLYASVSHDGGKTFGEPFCLIKHGDVGADNIMSVTLLRLANGDVGMFYLKKLGREFCVPYLVRSSDECRTWSKPVRCIPDDGYYVLNNDRVIRLASGRLLMPTAKMFHVLDPVYDGVLCIYASDDDGVTWKKLVDDVALPIDIQGVPSSSCVMEPGLAQLSDNTVVCRIRTNVERQYECFSRDDGETWTVPQPSRFTSAVSPLSMKKLSDGRIFTVWNPVPLHNGKPQHKNGCWTGARTPLAAVVLAPDGSGSADNYSILEEDENSGYSYCAIYETRDHDVLLAYCAGGRGYPSQLDLLRIRRIPADEIK